MKLKLVWRLGLAMALVGMLASGLTGYYGYTESRKLLQGAAEERLLTATRVLGRQLSVGLNAAGQDVRLIASHPGTRRLLGPMDADARERSVNALAQLFRSMLATHAEYFQMRLISASDHGMERVRVDRTEDGLLRVEGDDLQEKGHYTYVVDTLALPRDAVYVSRAQINHEAGAHAGQGKPSLQMATPVYSDAGQVLGLIVVNIDLNNLFAQLAADLPQQVSLYLSNGEGDFLIHPDRQKAFAFDRGLSVRVQDTFPAALTLLTKAANEAVGQLVTSSPDGDGGSSEVVAFVRQPLTGLHTEEDFVLGLGQPLDLVLAETQRVGYTGLRIVLLFSALSILLAAVLARALSSPLQQIVNAIAQTGRPQDGSAATPLPLTRTDEIGTLAKTVHDMQQQIRAQFDDLETKQRELDRLASHDTLTGLPNRRLFFDRLNQALARAKRHDGQLALLFIDLDHFKDINDKLGHAAGDTVLCAVGQRLLHLVREADTVARLGGDEFVILLDDVDGPIAVDQVAQRVLDALGTPVIHEGLSLICGGSVGVSRYPQDASELTELIGLADQAMYQAKSDGRHRVHMASELHGLDDDTEARR